MIRLTEIYILPEDSRGNMKRLLKMDDESIDLLHNYVPEKYAYMFAQWAAQQAKKINSEFGLESIDAFFNGYGGEAIGGKLFAALEANPGILNKIKKLDVDSALDTIKDIDTKTEKKDVVIDLGNGWAWVDLKKSACAIEADKMGHCGTDKRGDLISLRDKNNEPHVTMTWNKSNNEILQIKGKENNLPVEKYWPYIKKWFDNKKSEFKDEDIVMHALAGDKGDTAFIKGITGVDYDKLPERVEVSEPGYTWEVTGNDKSAPGKTNVWALFSARGEVKEGPEVTISEDGKTVWNIMSDEGDDELPYNDSIAVIAIKELLKHFKVTTIRSDGFESDYFGDDEKKFLLDLKRAVPTIQSVGFPD